jgi:L-lactate dehydrogenase complex protein LldE
MATVETLERFVPAGALELVFPREQTCCGQPMANTGVNSAAEPLARRFVEIFAPYEYIVCPSGSCTAMVRHHYEHYFHGATLGPSERSLRESFEAVRAKTYELSEFLARILGVTTVPGAFPYRVGLHQSCHGLRELRLASCSELVGPAENSVRSLIESLEGAKVVELQRPDECCGFGGTFAVNEEAVSCRMGNDRLEDHLQAGTQVLTANDMSCLMHLQGLIRRRQLPITVMHVAEILAGHQPEFAANLQRG